MNKISEQKALEAYPIAYYRNGGGIDDANASDRAVYEEGYNKAIQDLLKDANQYMFLSDEIGYAYASGCRKTMQDFLEKAEEFLYLQLNNGSIECGNIEKLIEQFKNYIDKE